MLPPATRQQTPPNTPKMVALIPAGFIALEAGWVVTEVGRQPWIVYHLIRTKDAVTPVPGQAFTFASVFALYIMLGLLSFLVLYRIYVVESRREFKPSMLPKNHPSSQERSVLPSSQEAPVPEIAS